MSDELDAISGSLANVTLQDGDHAPMTQLKRSENPSTETAENEEIDEDEDCVDPDIVRHMTMPQLKVFAQTNVELVGSASSS